MTYVITDFAVGDRVIIVNKNDITSYKWCCQTDLTYFIDFVCEVRKIDTENPSILVKGRGDAVSWFRTDEIEAKLGASPSYGDTVPSSQPKSSVELTVESAINFLVERGYEVIIKKANR